ncbi:MAG: hypothetical protein K2X67_10120 [Burkholderiales bacterium]|nr:hypothetical protein [Burkholderiales bacterium]
MDPASRLLVGLLLFALAAVPWARSQEIALTTAQAKALGVTTVVAQAQASGEATGLAAQVMVPTTSSTWSARPCPGSSSPSWWR